MKKVLWVVVIMLCVSVFALGDAYAAKPEKINGVSRITHSGDVKGRIDLTGAGDCISLADPLDLQVLVYVPGTSIVARAVPVDGAPGVFEFRLFDVPEGTQTVLVDVHDVPKSTLTTMKLETVPAFVVKRQLVLDLKTLTLSCPSAP